MVGGEGVGEASEVVPALERLLRLALPRFADSCLLDLFSAADGLRCVYAAHFDPEKEALLRAEIGGSPRSGPREQVARSGQALLARDVGDDELCSFARDDAHLALLKRLELRSVVAVPVPAHDGGRHLGVLSFGMSGRGRAFDDVDLRFALELARNVESIVSQAEERRLRERAERAADRMSRLQAITAALSRAPRPTEVAEVILAHGAEALGAEAGVLAELDRPGGALVVVRSFGQPSLREGQSIRLTLALPITEAARERAAIVLDERDTIHARFPMFEKIATVRAGGLIALPLIVDGRMLGAFQLCFGEGRHPRDLDRDFLIAISDLAAQALERARLLDDAQRAQQLFRSLADTVQQLVTIQGPDGKLEYFNQRLLAYTGLTAEEAASLELAALRARISHPDDIAANQEESQAGHRDGRPIEYVMRMRRADGVYRRHLARVVPLHDPGGAIQRWVGTSTDVEDLIRAETAHAALVASEHEFRERLMGIVGHDLRTPLIAIRLSAEALVRGASLDENHRATIGRVLRSVERMSQMIEQLLDFARSRESGGIPVKPAACDLGAVCRAILEELSAEHPARLELDTQGDLVGEWDRARLEQVVSNLVNNALDHGDGGAVRVRAAGEGDAVRLEVHNTGAAIAPDELEWLFDPYRRGRLGASAPRGNLGLGLYIVEQIVHAHDGAIYVRSTEQDGTTFTVRLPRARRQPADARTPDHDGAERGP
jgi:PAS domain S-box-containing protein